MNPGSSATISIPADAAVSNGATSRTFVLHVPTGYDPSVALPVVLDFHGNGGNAEGSESSPDQGFDTLAESHRFLAVYPQGLLLDGSPFWASAGPVDEGIDEAAFVTAMLNDLQRRWCVDARRIYATGFSNGGGMTGFLACRLASRIAAFAPMSGNYYALPGGCHPSRSVPLMLLHGTADTVVPYDGLTVQENSGWRLPSIPSVLQGWATQDGCTRGPDTFLSTAHITGLRWSGCQGDGIVIHYRAEGGGHSIPPSIDGHAAIEVIWQFFSMHSLPAS